MDEPSLPVQPSSSDADVNRSAFLWLYSFMRPLRIADRALGRRPMDRLPAFGYSARQQPLLAQSEKAPVWENFPTPRRKISQANPRIVDL
jgi:hypothetical protein